MFGDVIQTGTADSLRAERDHYLQVGLALSKDNLRLKDEIAALQKHHDEEAEALNCRIYELDMALPPVFHGKIIVTGPRYDSDRDMWQFTLKPEGRDGTVYEITSEFLDDYANRQSLSTGEGLTRLVETHVADMKAILAVSPPKERTK